jgi:spermidine synthase
MERTLPSAPQINRAGIAVLAAGTVNMGIEILGGRMLAPEFGSSVYTWGSIIGIFMFSLSLGYYIGGKRASEHASNARIGQILMLAAAYIGFLMVGADTIIQYTTLIPVSPRYSSVIPVTLLFGPPVFILGIITPYASELSDSETHGEASGNVFALGTVGSILGAFATTFVLIPSFEVAMIQLLFGAILAAAALIVTQSWEQPTVISLLLLMAFLMSTGTVGGAGDNVYHTQTPYQELEIRDEDNIRTLYLNDHPQSAQYRNGSVKHVWDYTRYFHIPLLMQEDVDNVLFIGGGGFTGPKRFQHDYNASIDVVEIDPDVVSSAKTYFNVTESEDMRIHVMDGRQYLEETETTYDLIVLDAFKKDKVPFHLTTREFFQLTSDRLDSDGTLLANLIAAREGSGSQFYRSTYRTLDTVYPQVYSFPTSETSYVQNIEVIASKDNARLPKEQLLQRNRERNIGINLSSEISSYQPPPHTDDVPLLTDDQAPVDKLLDPLMGRKYVIEQ